LPHDRGVHTSPITGDLYTFPIIGDFFYSSPGLIFFSWLVGGMIRLIRQRRLTFVVG